MLPIRMATGVPCDGGAEVYDDAPATRGEEWEADHRRRSTQGCVAPVRGHGVRRLFGSEGQVWLLGGRGHAGSPDGFCGRKGRHGGAGVVSAAATAVDYGRVVAPDPGAP